jgi:hypothetical protein
VSGANATRSAPPRLVLAALATLLTACNPSLPEPSSPGAKLYETRCSECHRLYPPNVMTKATWELMVDRMQGEIRRRGFTPLTTAETKTILDYLSRHAYDAGGPHDEG